MRGKIVAGFILLCGVLLQSGCGLGDSSQKLEEDFARRYQAAHEAGDVEAMLTLYWWVGVEDGHRFFVRQAVMSELEYPVKSIHFAPTESGDSYHYEHNGRSYRPNLSPYCRVEIGYDSPESMHASSLLGLHEGRLYLINPKPVAD